ncbi:hypothetical protein ABW19_dt0204123 [Dactylella cylindrospora]|nr:hypothetical protein ABW19_dt0204123 [Dactylella cylindrospora]
MRMSLRMIPKKQGRKIQNGESETRSCGSPRSDHEADEGSVMKGAADMDTTSPEPPFMQGEPDPSCASMMECLDIVGSEGKKKNKGKRNKKEERDRVGGGNLELSLLLMFIVQVRGQYPLSGQQLHALT